jgi:hypothetical protein
MTCHAERVPERRERQQVASEALEAAMSQIPGRETTKPLDQAPPITGGAITGGAFAHAPTPDGLRRTRVCVLCGQPLRAGQSMLRIQGSTIHARCSNASRDS